ncbi:MAG: MBL fold metallo-hydrolase [Flavobacteriales bacterium]|nr:MBL fold metallo-hydrolase [Flavobacteriales bacterium]
MKIEQLYTGCLAQGAYYIESKGEVAIIDPLREVQQYIDLAEERKATIKYVFETHFHADFVSGHVTLSERTGAPIIYGPNANPSFETIVASDEQVFQLGDVTIKVLHTPGHTMESTCYLLLDESGKEHALFSGDTLFLGDVGRPDLAQKAASMTQEDLAGLLFDSLRTKIMTLPDSTIVYPGHGAGSACGKNMSKETVGSIGDQKATNYALRPDMTKEEFVKEVTDGLLPPPAYFPMNVQMNKEGYSDVDQIIAKGQNALSPAAFEAAANETGAVVLDVRHQFEFVKEHVPRSTFIGIDGGFAPWVGALIKDVKQPILLITPEGRLKETITRLSRVGFDNIIGYLDGGIKSWKEDGRDVDAIETITAEALVALLEKENSYVVDVRKETEFNAEHLADAINAPLDNLNDHLPVFKEDGTTYMHCAGGYRSVIANSILKAKGIHNVIDVLGGFGAIRKTGVETIDFVCPSTKK